MHSSSIDQPLDSLHTLNHLHLSPIIPTTACNHCRTGMSERRPCKHSLVHAGGHMRRCIYFCRTRLSVTVQTLTTATRHRRRGRPMTYAGAAALSAVAAWVGARVTAAHCDRSSGCWVWVCLGLLFVEIVGRTLMVCLDRKGRRMDEEGGRYRRERTTLATPAAHSDRVWIGATQSLCSSKFVGMLYNW